MFNYIKNITAILLSCFCFCIACAQNNGYHFENITSAQGLADRLINAIIEDAQGYVWFGSNEGLTKYDGYTCTVYRHKAGDAKSISDNEIHVLCLDKNNVLWIGTYKGLSRYDVKNNSFDVFMHDSLDKNSIGGNDIFGLAQDAYGNMWVGSADGGLDMIVKKDAVENAKSAYQFIHYRHNAKDSNSLSDNAIFSLCFDNRNLCWISTASGLNLLNTSAKKITRFYHNEENKNSISNNLIAKIYKDENGDIWLCGQNMLDKILVQYKNNQPEIFAEHYLQLLDKYQKTTGWVINDFIIDKNGNAWLATNDNGLIKFKANDINTANAFEQFVNNRNIFYSLASSNVYSLYESKSNVVWIGTSKGVSKYITAATRFNKAGYLNNLLTGHSGFIMSLLADKQNRLWIGYDSDTLSVVTKTNNGASLQNIFLAPAIKDDQVNTIFQSSAGDIFIGTLLNGFYVIPASSKISGKPQWLHFTMQQFSALPTNNIYSFAEDKTSIIWIGTLKGLCKYDTQTKTVQPVHTPPSKRVTSGYIIGSMAVDAQNNLWFGTFDGVKVFNNGKIIDSFKNSDKNPASLSNNRINCLLIDHKQNIWVGTNEGLNFYDKVKRSFIRLTVENGLSNDAIKSLQEDKNGNLWIAANHGLMRYDYAVKKFFNYQAVDGLYSDQFVINSACKDWGGIFYFGTNNGIVSFKPENILPNAFIPPVVITNIKILDRDIFSFDDTSLINIYKKENKLKLKYNQNFFSFEFAALNYINTPQNKYAYILDGIDPRWNDAGTQRFARYADIRPGTYTFKVKAANNDGVWNNLPATVTIIIASPWWQTWWFYLLCAVAVCTIIYIIYRVRVKQILKLYKLRSSIAKDLHDDVGSALSSIALLSRIAQEEKANAKLQPHTIFSRIGDTSKRMIDLMDDIVWSVNPDNDRFSNMLVRMREYAAEMLEAKNINFSFKITDNVDALKIPMQKRKDYFLIFKEAINNLAKYSCAANAIISIECIKGNIITNITDDGKGFNIEKIHSGNGLKNMQSRAVALKGKLEIQTALNKGTSITLIISVA